MKINKQKLEQVRKDLEYTQEGFVRGMTMSAGQYHSLIDSPRLTDRYKTHLQALVMLINKDPLNKIEYSVDDFIIN